MEKVATLKKRSTSSYLARVPGQFRQHYALARECLDRRSAVWFACLMVWEGLRLHFRIPEGAERSSIEKDAGGKLYSRDARGTVKKLA